MKSLRILFAMVFSLVLLAGCAPKGDDAAVEEGTEDTAVEETAEPTPAVGDEELTEDEKVAEMIKLIEAEEVKMNAEEEEGAEE